MFTASGGGNLRSQHRPSAGSTSRIIRDSMLPCEGRRRLRLGIRRRCLTSGRVPGALSIRAIDRFQEYGRIPRSAWVDQAASCCAANRRSHHHLCAVGNVAAGILKAPVVSATAVSPAPVAPPPLSAIGARRARLPGFVGSWRGSRSTNPLWPGVA